MLRRIVVMSVVMSLVIVIVVGCGDDLDPKRQEIYETVNELDTLTDEHLNP